MRPTRVLVPACAPLLLAALLAACSEFENQVAPPGPDSESLPDVPSDGSDTTTAGPAASDHASDSVSVPSETGSESPADVPTVDLPDELASDAKLLPRDIHLTWQGDPSTTVTIQWKTGQNQAGDYVPKIWLAKASEVHDGSMPYSEKLTAAGKAEAYDALLEGGRVLWVVEISGLVPGTEYAYHVGTWESIDEQAGTISGPQLSARHVFRTAPAKGSPAPFRFLSAGDSRGGAAGIKKNIDRLADLDPAFWLFNGDMTDLGTQTEWDAWFSAMGPALVGAPLMPVQGNHELLAGVFYGQFALPRDNDLKAGLKEHTWSFDYGNTHFVGLDSNTDALVSSQNTWLEADLAKASIDPDIDWIIVMFHHPAYSASPKHGSTTRVQTNWVPLFEKYGVDLAFSGHDHDYERTHPVEDGAAADEGVVYVVAGGFYSDGYSSGTKWFTAVSHSGNKSNYAVVDIEGKSLKLTAYSGNGSEVLDTLELVK